MEGKVGFIGVGHMGAPMARNLLKRGHQLIVCDINVAHMNNLKEAGALTANSPADVASQASTIITMLPDDEQVQAVYSGEKGIFSTLQKGSLLIDCSTTDPLVAKGLATVAEEKGSSFTDAPVTAAHDGLTDARDALLIFLVGGSDLAYNAASEYLKAMGKDTVHCGPVGAGQAAKICNNMLLGISMIGLAETMNLGERLGLDPKVLDDILNMGSGRCWSSENWNPCPHVLGDVPSNNNYEGGFRTALMTKDLRLAQSSAIALRCPTPLGSLAYQLYKIMTTQGYGEKDYSVAYLFLQKQEKK